MSGVLDSLIDGRIAEGFAPPAHPPEWAGKFRPGDQVRVKAGKETIVGRMVRPADHRPATHAVVAPPGGAHVEAELGAISLDTPQRHAREAAKAEAEALKAAGPGIPQPGAKGAVVPRAKNGARSSKVLEAFLAEAFAVAPAAAPPAGETVAQSMRRGAASVTAAKKELAASAAWNASKHPRGAAGKFSYTSGGKRAHVGSSKSSTHSLSTKGYGNFVGVGARGALVQSVQRQLGIKSDGIFGHQTRAAIMKFQTNHGLKVDGIIGRQTLAALRGQAGAAKIAPGAIGVKTARVVKHAPRKVRAPARIGGGVVVGRP